ncbi:MAG: thioredoxin family protein [Ignavibacteriae bacterium]|nr:thioredoxin family protein [Ignavibacteriota bacterium]
MLTRVKNSALIVAFAIITIAGAGRAGTPAAEIGKPAPGFTLTDLEGKTTSLSDFAGKIVVLEWTNPNCPVVRRTYGSGIMNALQKEFTARGVVWLTVNSTNPQHGENETPAAQKERYAAWKASPTAQLLDGEGAVGRAFGAKTTPHMFIIDRSGSLAYNGAVDDDPRGGNADRTVYVKDALDALLAGKAVAVTVSKPYGCGVKY